MLFVVDSNNFLLRNIGGYGFRDSGGGVLQTSTGIETGMLLGAINSFISLQNRFEFDKLVFCFDAGRSTYRLGIRSSYKSNRNSISDPVEMYSLKPQFGYFQEFLEILGIAWTREPGVEADDYIATLCKTATEPVIVLSADHDLLQLVSDTVTVLRPSQGRTPEVMYTPEAVMAKYGLPPDKLAQMWAIMGDTGDGIIGIPKVGPVTATKMILKYGTLSDTLANEEKCNGYERIVRDNYRMIVLDGSVAKLPDGLNLSFDPGYPSELRRYFERFELNSLIRRFDLQRLWMQDEKDQ